MSAPESSTPAKVGPPSVDPDGIRHVEQLLTMSRDVALALASTSDLADAMRELIALCLTVRGLDAAGVYVVDHGASQIRLLAHGGVSQAFVEDASRYDFETPQAAIVLAGEPVYASYPAILPKRAIVAAREGLTALGVIPVKHGGRVVAALNVATRGGEAIAEQTRIAVETVATQIGAAMARLIAEERQALLVRELDHRVRNNLALVQSLASRALNRTDDVEAFRAAFTGRIQAMARTHEILAAGGWAGIDVKQVLDLALAPLRNAQFELDGPPVRLSAHAAGPLGMVLNELATNAHKYGALSTPTGRVGLQWTCGGGELTLRWRETGGPPVCPDATGGSGTKIIRALVEHELGGRLEQHFGPGGVRYCITLPAIDCTAAPLTPAPPANPRD